MRPDTTQEDEGSPDVDGPLTATHSQDGLLLAQAVRKAREHLIDPRGRAEHARAARAGRATQWGERDALITAQATQRKVAVGPKRAHPRTTPNAAVRPARRDARSRQAHLLRQSADQRRKRAAFPTLQRSAQDTSPLADSALAIPGSGKDITVALEGFGTSGDSLRRENQSIEATCWA